MYCDVENVFEMNRDFPSGCLWDDRDVCVFFRAAQFRKNKHLFMIVIRFVILEGTINFPSLFCFIEKHLNGYDLISAGICTKQICL